MIDKATEVTERLNQSVALQTLTTGNNEWRVGFLPTLDRFIAEVQATYNKVDVRDHVSIVEARGALDTIVRFRKTLDDIGETVEHWTKEMRSLRQNNTDVGSSGPDGPRAARLQSENHHGR